ADRELAHDSSEPHARIAFGRHGVSRRMRHLDRALEDLLDVNAHQRTRHQPEIAQRRVAAANVGWVAEDPAEAVVLRQLVESRARIRDGGEMPAGHRLLTALA